MSKGTMAARLVLRAYLNRSYFPFYVHSTVEKMVGPYCIHTDIDV